MNDDLVTLKNIKEKNDMPTELHYIIKLGDDYFHQQVLCNSIEDMKEKAKALETKFGFMELVIRVKKKNLVISAVVTPNTNSIYNYTDNNFTTLIKTDQKILDTGILFNPPLAKQINKFKNEIEKVETIDELLNDNPSQKIDNEIINNSRYDQNFEKTKQLTESVSFNTSADKYTHSIYELATSGLPECLK